MKRKSDASKLKEGRCLGEGKDYVGFLKANEAKSIGTACMIYDPIAGRTVDVLSRGEKEFFYIMRYRDDVETIQEQMRLSQSIVEKVCKNYGFAAPRHVLSTDFLITFKDGKRTAYSIKSTKADFDPESSRNKTNPKAYEKLMVRQYIELEYWKMHGVAFQIVFREDLNKTLAANVEQCMAVYDARFVTDTESMVRYLVAHKIIRIPLERERLRFAQLVKGHETEIQELFERSAHGK